MFKGNQVARLADGFTKLYVLTSLTDVSDKIRPLRQELCTGSLFRAFCGPMQKLYRANQQNPEILGYWIHSLAAAAADPF